jgi:group I intron endonuclease
MKNLAKGRKHSKEVKEAMSINRKGDKNSFFNKNHSLKTLSLMRTIALNRKKSSKPGFEVEIKNIENNTILVFSSIRKAAISMNSNIKTLLRREKLEKEKGIKTPYKNKYIITIKRN